ncbi:MAG: NADPH-dependent FMN reductase [Chloroflexia bacterium]
MKILAVSGSLREKSKNTVALRVDGMELFEGLGRLPHFNPDLDVEPFPDAVVKWREALAAADAVVISSPEYAHGVPGVLKNALDWVVGSGEFVEKPVAIVNLSPMAVHAQASLVETLQVMMGRVIEASSVAEALEELHRVIEV